jgi:PAS domain S-box-containing protein
MFPFLTGVRAMPNNSKSVENNTPASTILSAGQIIEDIRFRKLVEHSQDGIALFDKNLNVIYSSKSAGQITGWKTEDKISGDFNDIIHSDDKQKVRSDLNKVLDSPGVPVTSVYRIRHFEGHYIWLENIFTNMFDEPDINAIVCNFRDITENKKAVELLANRAGQIEEILESIGDAFFAVDKNWVVTYWNHMAEKVLGMPKSEVLNRNLWDVYADSVESLSYKKYHEAIEINKVVRFDDYYPPLNRWYGISAFPSGNGLSVYFKDITENLNYIKAIEEQNENLREISWLQSHVIRAPLARIMGLIQLIKDPNQDAAEKHNTLNYLLLSANELDEVIRTITDKTNFPRKLPTSKD